MYLLHKPVALAERMREAIPRMSRGQRMLAEYLRSNIEAAAFLTAKQLGAQVGLSESSVVRFAISLGYDGWPDLQSQLRAEVKARLSTVSRLRQSAARSSRSPEIDIMSGDMHNIRATIATLEREVFAKAVDAVSAASRVFIVGTRSARSLALFLGFCLEMCGKCVTYVGTGPRSEIEDVSSTQPDDVVIGISFARYSRSTVECFSHASTQRCTTIALTDSLMSPLAEMADITLTAKVDIDSFFESLVAPLSLINALVGRLAQQHEQKTLDTLERFEELCAEYRVYWEPTKGK